MKKYSDAKEADKYRLAARLLGQKLGIPWRELPREQVELYMQKLAVAQPDSSETEKKQN